MYNSHNIVLGIIYENLSINGCITKMWTMAIAINKRMQKRETLTRAHPVQKIKGRWWVLREGELALNESPNCLFSIKPSALKSYTHKQPSQTKKAVFMYLYIHTPIQTYIYLLQWYILYTLQMWKIMIGKEEHIQIAGKRKLEKLDIKKERKKVM